MTRTVSAVENHLASVRRARTDTRCTIDRKLAEVAALRAAYASQGRLLDQLLDERMDAAVAEAMGDRDLPVPRPVP